MGLTSSLLMSCLGSSLNILWGLDQKGLSNVGKANSL